jgi:protein-L-isoaspartate(D-aspartate) O-methyltransferase
MAMKDPRKYIQDQLSAGNTAPNASEEPWTQQRREMLEVQIRKRGIVDAAVLAAMGSIPRHEFVLADQVPQAYADTPLPIGDGQTISQPYIVAAMTEALGLRGEERVLEIGTGCGYQTAVLSRLSKEVFSVECRAELASAAEKRLTNLGFANVRIFCQDGTLGLPEFAPFDAILVAAAAPSAPPPLLAQLSDGGRLILPLGGAENQELHLIQRHGSAFIERNLGACRFVPLIGYYGVQESPSR